MSSIEQMAETVLAIDPGRAKCGLAVVAGPAPIRRHHLDVVDSDRLVVEISSLLSKFPDIARLLIGNGTGGAHLRRAIHSAFPEMRIETVDEHGSSARARIRWAQENPPPVLLRLLPQGMRVPSRPYDDYVALLLAENFFENFSTREKIDQ